MNVRLSPVDGVQPEMPLSLEQWMN